MNLIVVLPQTLPERS